MKILISILTILLVFMSCNRKSADIEIYEDGCKKIPITKSLGLYYETSQFCTNDSLTKSIHVNFATPQPECIDAIDIKWATFYKNNGDSMMGYTHTDFLTTSDPGVTMNNTNFYYYFCFTHPNQWNIDSLGYVILYYVAENNLGTESELKSVRINLPNFEPHPSSYNIDTSIISPTHYISICVWDYAAEDGDYIDLYLNGDKLLSNHLLLHQEFCVTGTLGFGQNVLVAYALNEGSAIPNTLAIRVNSENPVELNPGMMTGEAIEIIF